MTDTPPERVGESTWGRLRSRKVVQWGLVYVAAAWGFLQGLEYVSESFHWSAQLRQVAILALLIGLPIVLVLAWYHGDRGEHRIRGTELAIISLLFLVGGGIFWLYDRGRDSDSERGAAQDTAPAVSPSAAGPAPDTKSIAVLPFADMSPAKDQEYMSDGIAEELLNLLAKAPDLKVIARTSSFAFKGEKVDVAEIARRLNVAHILEGSVRTAGKKMRITAQLIRTADSTHLWSETYDRPLEDIFEVQDEIAGAIAQALQIKLAGGKLSRHEGGTQNLEAYQLYLRAISSMNLNTVEALDAAGDYLQRATEIDPTYGSAWLALANNVALQAESGYLPAREAYERMRQLAQHALELSPNLAAAHATLQNYHLTFWNWKSAETEGKRALALDPTDPDALLMNALLHCTFGRWEEAERQLRMAEARDPLSPFVLFNLGRVAYGAGRFEDAEAYYRRVLDVAPDFLAARAYLGKTLLVAGKGEAALASVQQEVDEPTRFIYLPIALQAAGRDDEADAALKKLITEWPDLSPFYIAQTYAYRGDRDRAIEWLERSYRLQDQWLFEILGEHLFNNMADDPRFKALLRKMKLPEWPHA